MPATEHAQAWIPIDDAALPRRLISAARRSTLHRAPAPRNWSALAKTFCGIPEVWLVLGMSFGFTRASVLPGLVRDERLVALALRCGRALESSASSASTHLLVFDGRYRRTVVTLWPLAAPDLEPVPERAEILAPSPGLSRVYGLGDEGKGCARVAELPLWVAGSVESLRAFGAGLHPKRTKGDPTPERLRELTLALAEYDDVSVGTHETFGMPHHLAAGFSNARSLRAELRFKEACRWDGLFYATGTRETPGEEHFRLEVEAASRPQAEKFKAILASYVRALAQLWGDDGVHIAQSRIARHGTRVTMVAEKPSAADDDSARVARRDAIVRAWTESGRAPVALIEELVAEPSAHGA